MNSNQPIPINTTITETPQIQTVVQDGIAPITSIINAPWVQVTSVNGKTGDVNILAEVAQYTPGQAYTKYSLVINDGILYYADTNVLDNAFNSDNWTVVSSGLQKQADWNTTATGDVTYIKNKPTKLSSFENDSGFVTDSQLSDAVSDLDTKIATINSDITVIKQDIGNIDAHLIKINTGEGV